MAQTMVERPLNDGSELTPADRLVLQKMAYLFRKFGEAALPERQEQHDAAISFGYLARIHHRLNEPAEAEAAYHQAITLFDALAADSGQLLHRRGRHESHRAGTVVRQSEANRRGDYPVATRAGSHAASARGFPQRWVVRQNLGVACAVLAGVFQEKGQWAEAEQALCQAVSLQVQHLASRPEDLESRRIFALFCGSLGQLQEQQKRSRGLEEALSLGVAVLEAHPPEVPTTPLFDEMLGNLLNDLGTNLMNAEPRRAEAEKHLLKAIQVRDSLATRFPSNTSYTVGLAGSCTNLGSVYYYMGHADTALDWHNRAVDKLAPIHHDDPGNAMAHLYYRNSLVNRARGPHGAAAVWRGGQGLGAGRPAQFPE